VTGAELDSRAVTAEGHGELPAEAAERVRTILERVVAALGLDATVEVSEADDEIVASLEGDDLGQIIGRRGQTIDAVQLICYRAALATGAERKRVIVDAAGYREERRQTVERQAERAAERALESGREIELEPMSPTERRVVHQHLKDRSGVETFSEGSEPERFVVVAPLVTD
jgi:spoIIIJ-associated protein